MVKALGKWRITTIEEAEFAIVAQDYIQKSSSLDMSLCKPQVCVEKGDKCQQISSRLSNFIMKLFLKVLGS